MMKSKKRLVYGLSICFFVLFLIVLFLKKYDVKIDYGIRPVASKPPKISFMIMEGIDDKSIRSEIDRNPFLMNEVAPYEDIDLKTPLISALAYKRPQLAEYMISKGVTINRSIDFLKQKHYEFCLNELRKILQKNKSNVVPKNSIQPKNGENRGGKSGTSLSNSIIRE